MAVDAGLPLAEKAAYSHVGGIFEHVASWQLLGQQLLGEQLVSLLYCSSSESSVDADN